MSHFNVLITLPAGTPPERIEDEIARRMEHWNENRSVEPYRNYEEGRAEGFWWVGAMRRGAQDLRDNAPSAVRYEEIFKQWSVGGARHFETKAEAVEFELKDRQADAMWAERLGDQPTWETVAQLYNERFGLGKELATEGDGSDSETLHYDAETGHAYTMSTYNPESMWDYWRIGGRWGGGYFKVKENGPGLITATPGWDSPKETKPGPRADGGPKRLLDFDAMRDEAAADADVEFDTWDAVCAATPVATSWPAMASLVDTADFSIDEARRRYHEQPRIRAAKDAGLGDWDCPVERFMSGREEFVAEARRAAVPGYALVTLDEQWIAPGRMGWFGMGSDEAGTRTAYRSSVNAYLDEKVADDDLVIVLDCHI
jgi:hypothetical protein